MIAQRILAGVIGFSCVASLLCSGPAQAQTQPVATVQATVLARAIARGTLLSLDDFTVAERSASQVRGTFSASEAAGKEAARNLVAGAVLRSGDVMTPRLVRRGEPVTITVRNGALAIVAGGRALASGGPGDVVRVVSLSTTRTLDAIVEGPGAVRVIAP